MANFADLCLATNGETGAPLQKLIQEIDIIMTAGRQSLITNYAPENNVDKYLFRSAVSNATVAKMVETMIFSNISTTYGFTISIDVQFLKSRAPKDMLYINIIIDTGTAREKLNYVIN